jgi:hypothetical protein
LKIRLESVINRLPNISDLIIIDDGIHGPDSDSSIRILTFGWAGAGQDFIIIKMLLEEVIENVWSRRQNNLLAL